MTVKEGYFEARNGEAPAVKWWRAQPDPKPSYQELFGEPEPEETTDDAKEDADV